MTSSAAPRSLTWLATRVLLVPVLILVVAGTFLFASRALAVRDAGAAVEHAERPAATQPWKASYSRRFPGCVPAVLWPGRETPVAVVVKWRGGAVERVDSGLALRRALSATRADDGRIIGACYR